MSFGEVDEALYSVRPDESGDVVGFFYPKREAGMDPQTSFDFFFSGEAGLKSPLLAENAGMYHPRLAQVKPGSDLVVPKVARRFRTRRIGIRMCIPGRTAMRGSSSISRMH